MDAFQAAADNFIASQDGGTSSPSPAGDSVSNGDKAPSLQSVPAGEGQRQDSSQRSDQAIQDLSKFEKFTIAGRELTREQLSKLLDQEKQFQSMNKDYTQKTQSLSAERKAFVEEQKFYQALPYDLVALRQDPARINEFLKLYPQKYHQYAENILKEASNQVRAGQNPQQQGQQRPVQDVQLLSRLQVVENFLNEQKTSEKEREIQNTLSHLDKKYPNAADFREMVLGRAFESHNQGTKLTESAWEDIYKQVDQDVERILKGKYGNMVKQQTEANKKGKDVGAGGGTMDRAPQKFKKFDDITKYALSTIE